MESLKLIIFIVIWIAGIVIALLGSEKLRDWKHYENPVSFLIMGIWLCILMSWVMVFLSIMNEEFSFPKRNKK